MAAKNTEKTEITRTRLANLVDAVDFHKHPRKLIYNRYADDFVILTSGPKREADTLKEEIKDLLQTNLKLTLSEDKTKITNMRNDTIKYLGFEMALSRSQRRIVRHSDGVRQRAPTRRS